MKKILFSAYTLDIGGIEKSLVNLLNCLIKKDYNITLVLEKKQGEFLNLLDQKVNIIEYTPSNNKNIIIRKLINLSKRIKFALKYKNKFDFSASFATYSKPGSYVARIASNNNALWIHSNYDIIYNKNKKLIYKFFKGIKYNKFKKIVCVSIDSKQGFQKNINYDNIYIINNLIDYNKILEDANKECLVEKSNIKTFLNIGRHSEEEKKITRLLEVVKKLKQDNLEFRVLMVGEGKDTPLYKKYVEDNNLQENVIFLGYQINPYPYFKICDAVWLTSEYEGYPVVFIEAMVLNKPILTTNVSDSEKDIQNKFGLVTNKDISNIYLTIKKFITNGYEIKNKFNPEKYNNEIIKKLEKIL